MGRGAYNFCPRASMPPLPELDPIEPVSMQDPIITPNKPADEAMTWHLVKPNRRNSSRVQWKPMDAQAIETPHTIAAESDNSWLAQQAEFSTPPAPPKRHYKPRAKAATLGSLHHATTPTPTQPTTPSPTHANDANKSQKTQNKSTRDKKKRMKDSKMGGLRKEAYVPPHLRNLGTTNSANPDLPNGIDAANGVKVDSAHGFAAASGSPTASDKSGVGLPNKLHSSPNGANRVSVPPPSPPTTPQEAEKPAESEKVVYNGWDEPKPQPAAPIRSKGNPRWPRGPEPYKKTVWPKQREMRYISRSSSDSDGGVSFKSNSNGDPDYDIKKLLDWNGDWLPAPESWSARQGYHNRHFGQYIEEWMNATKPECTEPLYLAPNTFNGYRVGEGSEAKFVLDGVCKELVPRYWMGAKVDGITLRDYWKQLPMQAPAPIDDVDLVEQPPWWELYEDVVHEDEGGHKHPSCYLDGLVVPEAKIDPTEPDNLVHPFGLASAEDKIRAKIKHAEEKHRRTMVRRNRPIPEPKFPVPQIEDRRLQPKANIYIRPVQPADVLGVTKLYNHYVENTIFAPEFNGRTEIQIRNRIHTITQAGLPFLVAVSKSKESRVNPGYVSEKIVGYISLDDYCDQSSIYRYTFDMELFVHPGYLCQGIAKCLMDRLLEMANTSYSARGGYQYVNHFEYLKTGPSRVIKTILLNVHHEHGQDIQAEWQNKFLNAFKFQRVGRLPQVGFKHGKTIDISIYAHHTKEEINSNALPTVAG